MTGESVLASRGIPARLGSILRARSSVATATGVIAAATATSKLGAAYKDVLVASRLGLGPELDSFLIGMLPVLTMTAVMAGSFSPALIPELVRVREMQGPLAESRFAASALGATIVLSALAAIAVYLFRLPLTHYLASGFTRSHAELAASYLALLLPLAIFANGAVTCSAVLNARSSFFLPSATPLLTAGVTILLLSVWPPDSINGRVLAIAALMGGLLEVCVLGVAVWRAMPAIGSLALSDFLAAGNLRGAAADCLVLSLSTVTMTFTSVITQSAASQYGPGQVAGLAYGSKVPGLLVTIALTAIGGAILPRFSMLAAQENWQALRNALRKYAGYSLAAAIPATALLAAFSPQIVSCLFERGRFGPESAANVAAIQRLYLLQAPMVIPGLLAVRVLTVFKATGKVLLLAGVNIVTCAIGVHYLGRAMGTAGIALSISLMYGVAAVMGFLLVRPEFARRGCR